MAVYGRKRQCRAYVTVYGESTLLIGCRGVSSRPRKESRATGGGDSPPDMYPLRQPGEET